MIKYLTPFLAPYLKKGLEKGIRKGLSKADIDISKYEKKMGQIVRAEKTILSHFKLGGKAFGFYIPYRYTHLLTIPNENYEYRWLKKKWDENQNSFSSWIQLAEKYSERFNDFHVENPNNVNQPRFNQDWFPGLDGMMAYTLVREKKPSKIIEVGSGHSTRFLRQAIIDENLSTEIHSIDPVPRRDIDKICDQITRTTVEKCPVESFLHLKENDILFMDGSHITMPGTDCDYLFHQVMPLLSPGVIVHIHDILLPYGYPEIWHNRSYNEQQSVLSMLSGGKRYQVLMSNAYSARHLPDSLAPLQKFRNPNGLETSLWLQISE